jgi:hypothetical protein
VMVNIYVPAGVGGTGSLAPPPLHAAMPSVSATARAAASTSLIQLWSPCPTPHARFSNNQIASKTGIEINAAIPRGPSGLGSNRRCRMSLPVVPVVVTTAVICPGKVVAAEGVNVQVASAGAPEHVSETVPEKLSAENIFSA